MNGQAVVYTMQSRWNTINAVWLLSFANVSTIILVTLRWFVFFLDSKKEKQLNEMVRLKFFVLWTAFLRLWTIKLDNRYAVKNTFHIRSLDDFAAYLSFCPRKILLTIPYNTNSVRSHEARCSLITKKLPWKAAGGLLREL